MCRKMYAVYLEIAAIVSWLRIRKREHLMFVTCRKWFSDKASAMSFSRPGGGLYKNLLGCIQF